MSVLPIVRLGDPVLRARAREVTLEELASSGIQDLIDDMIETKRDAHGAGIAAPQVGRSLRIAVVEVREGPRYPYKPLEPLTVIVNPVLRPIGERTYRNNEGCLSVPDLRAALVRSAGVRVDALDRHGVPFTREVHGLTAGTFQHEVDHLNGTLFVDRVDDTRTLSTWAEFDRFGRDEFVARITEFQRSVDAAESWDGADVGEGVDALLFDVFGTLVDWRGSIIRNGRSMDARLGRGSIDWAAIADDWRARYQPSMEAVRSGARPWVDLDVLHRESLEDVLAVHGFAGLGEREVTEIVSFWHRLDPWPDAAPALARLRSRYVLAPCSNGNVSMLVAISRHGGLSWDAILGAESTRHYKPQPEAYLGTARLLGVEPSRTMMVAAHAADLAAARALGFRTAFVARPDEHGPDGTPDRIVASDHDVVAGDLAELASMLGC